MRTLFDPIEKRYLEQVEEILTRPSPNKQEFRSIVQDEVSEVIAILDLLEGRWNITRPAFK